MLTSKQVAKADVKNTPLSIDVGLMNTGDEVSTLFIFGDESGTMPTKDDDKPFVGAMIAFCETIPDAIPGSDEDKKLVEILKQSGGIPYLAVVRPFPGYANKLKSKYDKMLLMARASRLLDGSTVPNLDNKGFNLGNQVWDHAMLQGVLHAVRCALYGWSIDSIRIVLDEKTMAKPRRDLFSEAIHRLGQRMQDYFDRLRNCTPGAEDQNALSELRSRIRFSTLSTTVHWSDDSGGVRSKFPLKLADRLARKMYRQLVSGSRSGIEQALREAGFEDFVHDITHVITQPLSQKAIDTWRRDTGLPEPRV